jgi:hypothetical protein
MKKAHEYCSTHVNKQSKCKLRKPRVLLSRSVCSFQSKAFLTQEETWLQRKPGRERKTINRQSGKS